MSLSPHTLRVMHLYRHSLKTVISWCVQRDIFWKEAARLGAEFRKNKTVDDPREIERLVSRAEARLRDLAHPDPYIVPWRPGGSLFERNPPMPHMEQVLDFGREGAH